MTSQYPLFDEFSFDWTLTVSVELFFFLQIYRAIKNRGTEFLLSSVPTVEGISSIVPMYHGIGGDPLEMGILRP